MVARLAAIAACVLALACACQSAPDLSTPSLRVFDQEPFHGTVVIQEAVSPSRGWVVLQDVINGQPGRVLGYAPVGAGLNRWVRVRLDAEPQSSLYAALYLDSGTAGALDIPGPDSPVTVDGAPLIARFRILEPSRFLSAPDR